MIDKERGIESETYLFSTVSPSFNSVEKRSKEPGDLGDSPPIPLKRSPRSGLAGLLGLTASTAGLNLFQQNQNRMMIKPNGNRDAHAKMNGDGHGYT